MITKKPFIFLISILPLLSLNTFATEVDQLTDSDIELPDITEKINELTNVDFANAVSIFNSKFRCESGENLAKNENLLNNLQFALDENWPNIYYSMTTMLSSHRELVHLPTNSEYKFFSTASDWIINIKGHKIGIDKIDHMFGHGFVYFKRFLETKNDKEELFKIGEDRERGLWGLIYTIKSCGDKAANYKGFLIWLNFFEGSETNLICKGGKVVIQKKIDIGPYVDDSLNESINCSNFTEGDAPRLLKHEVDAAGKECPLHSFNSGKKQAVKIKSKFSPRNWARRVQIIYYLLRVKFITSRSPTGQILPFSTSRPDVTTSLSPSTTSVDFSSGIDSTMSAVLLHVVALTSSFV